MRSRASTPAPAASSSCSSTYRYCARRSRSLSIWPASGALATGSMVVPSEDGAARERFGGERPAAAPEARAALTATAALAAISSASASAAFSSGSSSSSRPVTSSKKVTTTSASSAMRVASSGVAPARRPSSADRNEPSMSTSSRRLISDGRASSLATPSSSSMVSWTRIGSAAPLARGWHTTRRADDAEGAHRQREARADHGCAALQDADAGSEHRRRTATRHRRSVITFHACELTLLFSVCVGRGRAGMWV